MAAAAALSAADSLAIDGLYSSAIDAYTEVICLTDDRASSGTPLSENGSDNTDRLTLRFLALSHRCAAHMALSQHKVAYNDAKEALGIVDTNRYDFAPAGSRTGKKLRYEQVAQLHDRAATSIMALNESKSAEVAKGHWESALTLAAMGENEELAERYQNCLAALSADAGEKESDEKPIVEEVEKPSIEVVERPSANKPVVKTGYNKPMPTTKPAPSASTKADQTPKYQYYQDATWMKIQILESNLTAETCSVSIAANSLTVSVKKNGSTFTVIHGDLSEAVVPEKCRTLYKEEKVLIKLKKVEEGEWHSLLDDKKKKTAPKPAADKGEEKMEEATKPKTKQSVPRPYASHKDWDAIDRDLKAAEEAEKPEGEEALNTLFKQIYANANEDTRRAMVKSMQTSGGTVLSTNWDEVKEADYEKERVAPKGMEWKNYEGDKLKMKEDD